MRTAVCFLFALALTLSSYAQDATWQLKNEYEIAVLDGESTGFKPPDGDPLVSISFDSAQYKPETFSSGSVRMIELHSDQPVRYVAKISDSSRYGMVMIGIPTLQNLYITLYVVRVDDSTYKYSYALAFDLDKGAYLSAKDRKNYLLFIGTMRRLGGQADPARELVQNQIKAAGMENIYTVVAGQMTTQFLAGIQPSLKREPTDDEKQRLNVFWYKKLKEILPETSLEDSLVPVVKKYLGTDEMSELNAFFRTATGKKYLDVSPIMSREAEGAGAELATRLMTPGIMDRLINDLKAEFPYWF